MADYADAADGGAASMWQAHALLQSIAASFGGGNRETLTSGSKPIQCCWHDVGSGGINAG
jgi:hypothetical protein